MLPGINPRKMEQLMKQMGISSKTIPARKVIIEAENGKYVVDNPQVVQISMQGQKSFQISGNIRFEEEINEEDVKMVMEKTGCERRRAVDVLRECKGNIAEAIIKIEENKKE